MERNLATGATKAFAYLSKTTAYWSLRAEATAKKGAKWTDRTGNARQGLSGTYRATRSGRNATFEVELSHSVPYGFWLEVRNFPKAGKLAIIKPTVDNISPQFFKQAQTVLDRIFA